MWHFGDVHSSYDNGANGVVYSYGRIQSPFTRNDIEASQINPSGDVYNGIGYVYIDSYGRKNRRTLIGAVVYVLSSHLVTSTATTTLVSAVPTDFYSL